MDQTPQDEAWFIYDIEEFDDYKSGPVTRGYFFVAARNPGEASTAGEKASYSLTQSYSQGIAIPAAIAARYSSEWPGRISKAAQVEIERDCPEIIVERGGFLRLALPPAKPPPNRFVFFKAALSCLPLAMLAGTLRRFTPPDLIPRIPPLWTPTSSATLLLITAVIVVLTTEINYKPWPFWKIVGLAFLVFAAGLWLLAQPEMNAAMGVEGYAKTRSR